MPAQPVAADAPDDLYRVARRSSLLYFSPISPSDAALKTAGNRFDVPGGGVLYAGATVEACYAETLARMRPTPQIRELLKDEEGFMAVGGVPQDWRLQRVVGTLGLVNPLPFLDVEATETQAHLSEVLASEMVALGYTDNLDIAAVCNSDRRLSRAIAEYAYTATDVDGSFLYSGLRYASRINPSWDCWAIFDGTEVYEKSRHSIESTDPILLSLAATWDLHIW